MSIVPMHSGTKLFIMNMDTSTITFLIAILTFLICCVKVRIVRTMKHWEVWWVLLLCKTICSRIGTCRRKCKMDDTKQLLKDALNYVVFIPWSAGTMSSFEYELYAKIYRKISGIKDGGNCKRISGYCSATERGENYCDAATKTHINDDPAQYYDYALSFILLFQVHDYISKNILKQDPHSTNYFGNKEIGKFIGDITKPAV